MSPHLMAGKVAPHHVLVNIPRLVASYYSHHPDVADAVQRVSFGTSGHRGTSLNGSFNEDHILAISQAVCEYRALHSIHGPLFLGMDTHALSEPALMTAVEVFAANEVDIMLQQGMGYTPTPVISRAILRHNQQRSAGLADGVVITPSHNPPQDGGYKYNPPSGGPADAETTRWIQDRANQLLAENLQDVKRLAFQKAMTAATTHRIDFVRPYVDDLRRVVNFEAIATAGLKLGVDPMGGAGLSYWQPIAETYHLNIEIVNERYDPTFSFMTLDHDGKIRMDCSSPYAMASLVNLKTRFDIAFGNDTDFDRHGIVTRSGGLLNANHYLAAAITYLFQNRSEWGALVAVGKTMVSSSMIDRVAASLGRRLCEVPVGFKWFVEGLLEGSIGFGGEESAGASFLCMDGSTWTTDKDGFILDLLAAEMLAVTGRDPAELYQSLVNQFGEMWYARTDAPTTRQQKALLTRLAPENLTASHVAGDKILSRVNRSPHLNAPLGGLKVLTQNGWFAARPSGTEDVYKIYAESYVSADHLSAMQAEAQAIVDNALQQA